MNRSDFRNDFWRLILILLIGIGIFDIIFLSAKLIELFIKG